MAFIQNKVLSFLFLPFRLVAILFRKNSITEVNLKIDRIIIVDGGISKIIWSVDNAFLVTISGIGVVKLKGEYILKNRDLSDEIQLKAYGKNGVVRKKISMTKLKLEWGLRPIPIFYNRMKFNLKETPKLNIPIPFLNTISPNLNFGKQYIAFDTRELLIELQTNQ